MKTATGIPDAKADGKQLRTFFREVAPDHDEEKVYASDMKKVITWFQLLKDLPVFNEEPEIIPTEAPVAESPAVAEVELVVEATKKPAKKAAKPVEAEVAEKPKAKKPAKKAE